MNQAILMSEQDNGEAGEWLKEGGIEGDIKDEDNNPDFGKNSDVIMKFVNQYLKPYIKIVDIGKSNRTVMMGKILMEKHTWFCRWKLCLYA